VRDWIHVQDHCDGLLRAADRGRPGETYNLGGNSPRKNLEVARRILRILGRSPDQLEHVVDRPGHDRRYAIDNRKARRDLGWAPRRRFEDGLHATIDWYLSHERWWARILSGDYLVRRRRAERPGR
jgi:dTDP-glucose 4,6-dehydratase